jgi:hypothetical protein
MLPESSRAANEGCHDENEYRAALAEIDDAYSGRHTNTQQGLGDNLTSLQTTICRYSVGCQRSTASPVGPVEVEALTVFAAPFSARDAVNEANPMPLRNNDLTTELSDGVTPLPAARQLTPNRSTILE